MIRKTFFILFATIGLIAFNSCEKEIDEREADELLRFEAFMSLNYPEAIKTASGMYYIIYSEGEGNAPSSTDYILFNYIGQDLDDNVFETTKKTVAYLNDIYSNKVHYVPSYRKYNDVDKPLIKGLKEGFALLKEGGKAKFFIPSKLAYGPVRHQGLTPYSSVIFDVELIRVISDPKVYELELINNYIATNYPDYFVDGELIEGILVDEIYILENVPEEVVPVEGEEEEDNGPKPILDGETVEVSYTGRFLDHWIFDTNIKSVAEENESYNPNVAYTPLRVKVGGTGYIKGFSLALQNLTTKTYAKVIIPSKHAYGEIGASTIPTHTPLIFELTILDKVQ
jgi:FKBP-type peptidyl-prolyl cis-trans isomerase